MTASQRKAKYPLGDAIIITWHDAVSNSGWEDIGHDDKPHQCRSIGFLAYEDDDYVIVAATLAEAQGLIQTNNRISIPKGWILSRTPLDI